MMYKYIFFGVTPVWWNHILFLHWTILQFVKSSLRFLVPTSRHHWCKSPQATFPCAAAHGPAIGVLVSATLRAGVMSGCWVSALMLTDEVMVIGADYCRCGSSSAVVGLLSDLWGPLSTPHHIQEEVFIILFLTVAWDLFIKHTQMSPHLILIFQVYFEIGMTGFIVVIL